MENATYAALIDKFGMVPAWIMLFILFVGCVFLEIFSTTRKRMESPAVTSEPLPLNLKEEVKKLCNKTRMCIIRLNLVIPAAPGATMGAIRILCSEDLTEKILLISQNAQKLIPEDIGERMFRVFKDWTRSLSEVADEVESIAASLYPLLRGQAPDDSCCIYHERLVAVGFRLDELTDELINIALDLASDFSDYKKTQSIPFKSSQALGGDECVH